MLCFAPTGVPAGTAPCNTAIRTTTGSLAGIGRALLRGSSHHWIVDRALLRGSSCCWNLRWHVNSLPHYLQQEQIGGLTCSVLLPLLSPPPGPAWKWLMEQAVSPRVSCVGLCMGPPAFMLPLLPLPKSSHEKEKQILVYKGLSCSQQGTHPSAFSIHRSSHRE